MFDAEKPKPSSANPLNGILDLAIESAGTAAGNAISEAVTIGLRRLTGTAAAEQPDGLEKPLKINATGLLIAIAGAALVVGLLVRQDQNSSDQNSKEIVP